VQKKKKELLTPNFIHTVESTITNCGTKVFISVNTRTRLISLAGEFVPEIFHIPIHAKSAIFVTEK
jgi:hypothetical protein